MKIMHVCKRYPDATGGDAFVVLALEHEQAAAGHDVTVVTSRSPEIRKLEHVIQVGAPLEGAEFDTIGAKRIQTMARLAFGGFALLRRRRPDVIHAHTADLGFALSLAARWHRIPQVITLHSMSIGKDLYPWPKRFLEAALLRGGGYRRIVIIDPSIRPALTALGLGERIEFIPNGVPEDEFCAADRTPDHDTPDHDTPDHNTADHNTPDHDTADQGAGGQGAGSRPEGSAPTILFVGRLEPVKGVSYLLRAFAAVSGSTASPGDGPRPRLVIAGTGSDDGRLQAEAAELGLDGSVDFVGNQSRAQVHALYREAAVFILPTLDEGFPLVLLEAWAHSLPVVVTKVGAVPHVCVSEADSLLVDPADTDALAAALTRLLSDPALREKLGAEGKRRVDDEFEQTKIAARILATYVDARRGARPAGGAGPGRRGGRGGRLVSGCR